MSADGFFKLSITPIGKDQSTKVVRTVQMDKKDVLGQAALEGLAETVVVEQLAVLWGDALDAQPGKRCCCST